MKPENSLYQRIISRPFISAFIIVGIVAIVIGVFGNIVYEVTRERESVNRTMALAALLEGAGQ